MFRGQSTSSVEDLHAAWSISPTCRKQSVDLYHSVPQDLDQLHDMSKPKRICDRRRSIKSALILTGRGHSHKVCPRSCHYGSRRSIRRTNIYRRGKAESCRQTRKFTTCMMRCNDSRSDDHRLDVMESTCRLIVRVSGRQKLARLDGPLQCGETEGIEPIASVSPIRRANRRERRHSGRGLNSGQART